MPLPTDAADDSLHRFNCCATFSKIPPKAWEFLFYIPNHHHPIQGDEGLRAHFCLVLPDEYKRSLTCNTSSSSSSSSAENYRAVALITRKPRFSTRSKGYRVFKPHTAHCTCAQTSAAELETSVFDRVSLTTIESPCHLYNRSDKAKNKGHFETWSWYANSVIPIQAPKMVHVDCLHLMRPLTQPRFGLTLNAGSLKSLEGALRQFREVPPKELVPPVIGEGDGSSSLVSLEDALHMLDVDPEEVRPATRDVGVVEKRTCSIKRMLSRRGEVTRKTSLVELRRCSIKRMLGRHDVTQA